MKMNKSLVSSPLSLVRRNIGFENLKVWQKAIVLSKEVYYATQNFPKSELYGMSAQIRSACVSVASNIAEGCARNNTKEFIQFLGIATGSLAELKTQLIICKEVGLIEDIGKLLSLIDEIARMLSSLKFKLKTKV